MKLKLVFFSVITLSYLILGCNNNNNVNNDNTDSTVNKLSLRLDWIPTMSFSGDYVGKKLYSEKYKLDLTIEPAYEGVDPLKMIISGQNQIGIISAEKLYLAIDKGADLVAIGVIDYITPTVFMSKKKLNIIKPEDLYGKKVGIQSGGATESVYKALKNICKLDEKKINEIQIGFDMKPFINGTFDVRPGFIFDEVVYLDLEKIEYNLIEPSKFGLNFPGRVYFTTRDFYEKNPEVIKNFIYCMADGWINALENPNEAIKTLKEIEPTIDTLRELSGLIKGKTYLEGYDKKILFVNDTVWNNMLLKLTEIGILPKMNFENYNKFEYIKEYHKIKK